VRECKDVAQVGETEVESPRMSSMKRWKVWAAFRRQKDMKGNSKRPKGVVIAVFCISAGWTGIWLYALTRSILEKTSRWTPVGGGGGGECGPGMPAVHQEAVVGEEVCSNERLCDVGHHEAPRELSTQSQVEAKRQPFVGGDGCGISLWGNTQRSEPVSIRKLSLLDLSVKERRPVAVVQTFAAAACLL
jgi:hypothetical protein